MSTVSSNPQLQKRVDYDNKAMADAVSDLLSVVGRKRVERPSHERKEQLQMALEAIFAALSLPIPDVPQDVQELDLRLDYMLRPSGVMRRRVELKGRWWQNTMGPLLGSTKSGDVVAILPAPLGGYFFLDPSSGKRVKVKSKTAELLERDAFCFYRSLPARQLKIRDLLIFMLRSLDMGDVLFVLLLSLLVSLLGLFTPYMNKQIFDSVIPTGTKGDLLPVAALLLGATIGSALFTMSRTLALLRLRDKMNHSVQCAAMARMFTLPVSFYKDFAAGETARRAMSINSLTEMLSDSVLTSALAALFSFVYIFQMFSFAPILVAPAVLAIVALLLVTFLSTSVRQKHMRKMMQLSAKLDGLVFGLFSGIQKIKIAGAERRAFAKWAANYRDVGRLRYNPPLLMPLSSAVSTLLMFGSTITVYFFAGSRGVSPSDFIAFTVAYGAVSSALMSLGSAAIALANVKPQLEMVKPILEAVPEVDENKRQVTSLSGLIEVSNVTFSYTKDGPPVLRNLSLKVEPGEYVAIVGRSGSGKSTLMRLLLGFETPNSGAIYYDGHDLKTLDVRSVRQCIGVDLQDAKLFLGSIYANIIITAPWATLEDAWEAARLAGVDEDIRAMPMGMHTLISEGGGGISGGQRQRLLIARAIIAKPSILLLDEATSALDNITQEAVIKNLAKLKCTRVVIAHRLSTVQGCDRILVMDEGTVVEEGTYDELMARKGLFFEFASRQIQ
ncbi:MAG: NHLP bacteriocin export ABC transporter permease/ATPase subunit [Limnochordia bacterium]